VIWQFASLPLNPEEITLLNKVNALNLEQIFNEYLTANEIIALRQRVDDLLAKAVFPEPSQLRPAIPWPPV
jgi:hypothetical protein